MSYALSDAGNVAGCISAIAAITGAAIAFVQLRKLNASSQAANLLKLRELLSPYDHIELKLRPHGEWQERDAKIKTARDAQAFDKYAGLLEAGLLLIKERQLDRGCFDEQFGYRIANIGASSAAKARLKHEKTSWQTLISELRRRGSWPSD